MKDTIKDTIKVLIVDDHAVVREGIKTYLDLHPAIEVIGEASSGEAAIKFVREKAPQVVIMDLHMPGGMDGIESTRRIRKMNPDVQVIVLTSYDQDEYIFPALRAGALSYVLKTLDADDLTEAILKASENQAVLHSKVASRLVQEMHGNTDEADDPAVLLSSRELEVLQCIASGMDNNEISEKLDITVKTVRTHVSNILNKLHLRDRTQVAIFAWREGLVS